MTLSLKEKYVFIALVGLLSIALLSIIIFPAHLYQWSPPCFFKKELGLYCTFCGGYRSISYLLNGDVSKAWFYNPLVVLAAPYFFYHIIKNCWGLWWVNGIVFKTSISQFYLFLAIVIGFTIFRNTVFYTSHF